MGFGHREYRVKDPRASILQEFAEELFARFGKDEMYEVAKALEVEAIHRLGPKGIYPNVDFYSGVIYNAIGTPSTMFTALFAIGRLPGWISQWTELHRDEDFKIGRPRQTYVGETKTAYTPIDER